jgi:hypothetical protein
MNPLPLGERARVRGALLAESPLIPTFSLKGRRRKPDKRLFLL